MLLYLTCITETVKSANRRSELFQIDMRNEIVFRFDCSHTLMKYFESSFTEVKLYPSTYSLVKNNIPSTRLLIFGFFVGPPSAFLFGNPPSTPAFSRFCFVDISEIIKTNFSVCKTASSLVQTVLISYQF